MQSVIIIPARLQSSRLPEKLLLPLQGKPIIQWTYEACLKSKEADAVWIAVDHPKLLEACQQFTDQVRMTSDHHQSGTDRIAELAQSINPSFVINVQGDEPFIDSDLIDDLFLALRLDDSPMVSAMFKQADLDILNRPEAVKVVVNHNLEALYFSRQLIPFPRDENQSPESFWQHIGLYGFRKESLDQFVKWPASLLEKTEKLEQLRALENGLSIKMVIADQASISIDTPSDYEAAQKMIEP